MRIINKIKALHDAALLRELSRPRRQFKGLLFVAGLVGCLGGWQTEGEFSKVLLISGGLALGLAAEKMAQSQIKRVLLQKRINEQN